MSTSKETRSVFEKQLLLFLKEKFNNDSAIKVNRNEIVIKTSGYKSTGRIHFRYLNNAKGYVLGMSVDAPELMTFIQGINPPYKSNWPSSLALVMTTSMEKYNVFSNKAGGTLDLPESTEGIEKTCNWIEDKVRHIYLVRALNLMDFKQDAIQDVLDNPGYYAYPFLTILYIIEKFKIKLNQSEWDNILNKRIVGNKSFDKELLSLSQTPDRF